MADRKRRVVAPRPRQRLPERVYRRRRRVAAGILVAVLSAGAIGLELGLSDPIYVNLPTGTATAMAPSECTGDDPAALRTRLGGRLIVRMEAEASEPLRRQARRGEIGGVILFPPPGADLSELRSQIAELQRIAADAGEPPLLVAIDQEGGAVKRLPELPPDLAPPEIAARGGAAAGEQGRAAGEALSRLGINVDLAPVLDVPATTGSFIASRALGSTPTEAAENGAAFAAGLSEAGVAATAKHFPGLGRSPVNTDLEPSEITAGESELRSDLEPFERVIGAGIPLVMLSNATYPRFDPDLPAFASRPVAAALLREELGFEGVTISDDLGAGAVRASFGPPEAARAAIAGGTDLLLYAQTSEPRVLDDLVREAERGGIEPGTLEESCVRVRALRESLGG